MARAGMFRRRFGAVLAACLVAALVGAGPSLADGLIDVGPPNLHTGLVATPAPIPAPFEGRMPVSLRLANSIWTDDGSHPSAATEVRFDLDKQLQFEMADIPICKPTSRIPRGQTPCDEGKVASGRMQVEVQFPEQQPIRVLGDATAYKTGPRSMMIFAFLPAPVTAMLLVPVTVSRGGSGIYGFEATASIPKVAGGSGSLTYLGLRFRKGLFSAACPKRRLQSRVTNTFADGARLTGGLIITC
jgi:hypothetical protein